MGGEFVLFARIAQTDDQKFDFIHSNSLTDRLKLVLFFLLFLGGRSSAFLFFLALLNDFGLGGSGSSGALDAFSSRSLFSLQSHDVRDDSVGRTDQFDPFRHRHAARTNALSDHELGDLDAELLGNRVRKTLDFDFARHDFVQSALDLYAFWFARRQDRNTDAERLVRVDPLQIDMEQRVLHRVGLPIHDHDRRGLAAVYRKIENRVVPGLAVEDTANFFRAYGHRDGCVRDAIDYRRSST